MLNLYSRVPPSGVQVQQIVPGAGASTGLHDVSPSKSTHHFRQVRSRTSIRCAAQPWKHLFQVGVLRYSDCTFPKPHYEDQHSMSKYLCDVSNLISPRAKLALSDPLHNRHCALRCWNSISTRCGGEDACFLRGESYRRSVSPLLQTTKSTSSVAGLVSASSSATGAPDSLGGASGLACLLMGTQERAYLLSGSDEALRS